MHLEAWLFSAKQAWHRPLLRWMTVVTLAMVVLGSSWFLWRVIPHRQSGTLVLHYNVYLGVDEVRAWEWILLLPGIWFIVSLVDVLCGYGFYHRDPQLAGSLIGLAFFWSVPWMIALYYLTLVNV